MGRKTKALQDTLFWNAFSNKKLLKQELQLPLGYGNSSSDRGSRGRHTEAALQIFVVPSPFLL